MEQPGPSDYSFMRAAHEYPDPDYAAYVTRYPWREDDGYLPSALDGLPSESVKEISRPGNHGNHWNIGHEGGDVLDKDAQGPARVVTWDPDYQVSEADLTYLDFPPSMFKKPTF